MINFIRIMLISLLGLQENVPVHDLRKQPDNLDFKQKINCWVNNHLWLLGVVIFIVGLFLFVWFCFWICGLAAVESGMMRNFLGGI